MSISASGKCSAWPLDFCPLESLSVEHAHVAVIPFAVVTTEYVEFLPVQCGSMIFNAGSIVVFGCRCVEIRTVIGMLGIRQLFA